MASDRQRTEIVSMAGSVTCSRRSALRRVTTGCEALKGGAARRGAAVVHVVVRVVIQDTSVDETDYKSASESSK